MLYPVVPEIWFMAALGIVEGTAFALVSPALFLLVARASPAGMSSTAQGVFGAAGTVGTIVASLAAGALAAANLTYPFYATGIAGAPLARDRPRDRRPAPVGRDAAAPPAARVRQRRPRPPRVRADDPATRAGAPR